MKLFILSPDILPNASPTHVFGDRAWALAELCLQPDAGDVDFICVSYSWGLGRAPSVFHPSATISDRTEAAVSAVIAQRPTCERIWVDAFCVPGEDRPAERAATLESMGFIYSQASEVVVVLTAQAYPAIEQVRIGQRLSPKHLDILEREDWVTRAWTYQEAVNSKRLSLTCENAPRGTIVSCTKFLSYLGHALILLPPDERAAYPRLSSFEDVIADCQVGGYLERSALQIMSIMDQRTQTRAEDHFYAMIGALSTEPAKPQQLVSPCEAFMSLCEREGDFSFIFAAAERDKKPGRRWRPAESPELPAIIRLPSWGSGLRGRMGDDRSLVLENVVVLKPAPAMPYVEAFITEYVTCFRPDGAYASLDPGKAAYQVLRDSNFLGSSEHIATEHGLFFPRKQLPPQAETEIVVAVGIRWSLGAAAIARYVLGADSDGSSHYEPGIFFGRMADRVGSPTAVRFA